MARTAGKVLALLLLVVGGLVEVVGLVLPWVRYRVEADLSMWTGGANHLAQTPGQSIFQVRGGGWYLVLLLLTVLLLAGALGGPEGARRPCGALALAAGVCCAFAGAVLVAGLPGGTTTATALGVADVHVHPSTGIGRYFGLAGPVLLGLGAAGYALAWRPSTTRAGAGTPAAVP